MPEVVRWKVKWNGLVLYYALENPSEICTTERTYKVWQESNKTKWLYTDANKVA